MQLIVNAKSLKLQKLWTFKLKTWNYKCHVGKFYASGILKWMVGS
jgi:hypothetical protein